MSFKPFTADLEVIIKFNVLGKYFGYPQCCIDSFIVLTGSVNNPLGAKVGNSTGFIPCPVCAQKVISEEVELKELIINRECPEPFPIGDGCCSL